MPFTSSTIKRIFTGIVRAAMKKKLQYNFKIKFAADGEILNTHCECPGGKVRLLKSRTEFGKL